MKYRWKRWIWLALLCLIPFPGNAVTPMLAGGASSSLFLHSDGSVWGTGNVTRTTSQVGATSPIRLLQLPNVVAVDAGTSGSDFAVLADGTLWGSGENSERQLADGTTQYRFQPQPIPGLSGIKAVAVEAHVLALKQDGTVWAWGRNDSGELGDGTRIDRYAPVQVVGLFNVAKISAGIGSSLALKADGTVWGWGGTRWCQNGNVSSTGDPGCAVPGQVSNLDQVVAIAAGAFFGLVLRADGTVWAWGQNDAGQLGNGTLTPANGPVRPLGLSSVMAIAAGANFSLALKPDGSVWAWGNNNAGQLGVSGITYSATPVQVPGLADIVALGAGWNHALAMRRDGTVFSWGANSRGQLGDGTLQNRSAPQPVLGPGGSGQLNLLQPPPANPNQLPQAQISLSVNSGSAPLTVQASAVDATDPDGTIAAFYWRSSDGQQATGPSATFAFTQAGTYQVDLLIEDNTGGRGSARQAVIVTPAVAAVSASPKAAIRKNFSMALTNDGRIRVWGWSGWFGFYDRLAQEALPRLNPLPLANGITGAIDFASGGTHAHVLLSGGSVLGWGSNPDGTAGVDSQADAIYQPQTLPNLPAVQALAAGGNHGLALTRDGRVFSWGGNAEGQLGLGDSQNRNSPVEVAGLSGVVAIAAGWYVSMALKADGTVWAWGNNNGWQLGDGTRISRNRPIQVPTLANVQKIFAASWNAGYAIKGDGTVWATGQVPAMDGDPGPAAGARHLSLLDGVVQIAAGDQHIIARKTDGTVWTVGARSSQALGLEGVGDVRTPRQIPGIADGIWVAADDFNSMVLRRDGTVLAWGLNNNGQIGDGTLAPQSTPVLVVNEAASNFLDLIPEIANTIPQDKIPPFFLATFANGDLSSTTLYADLRGITASGTLTSAADFGRFAAGYNVYVAANVPTMQSAYFQLDSSNNWSLLSWPMIEFMRGMALDSQNALVRANILQNADVSQLVGASILVGYGTDPDEMLRNTRYRTIFAVPSQ